MLSCISALNKIAKKRGQSLAQMALAWILQNSAVTSVLIGASKASQVLDSIQCIKNIKFSEEELNLIDKESLADLK